ncbi:MAG: KilA-N domain-containing protein [Betaproteobacteria bacterium]|nr:MAG: KilA-N domain-containing protein [Betaproteobacteria bacterium]
MPQHQYSLALIQHEVNNSVIEQRASDGYINASALCAVAGRRWHNYVREETTGHFLRALSAKTGIVGTVLAQEVIGEDGSIAIWVHPQVAINLAQWLSAEFAVQVTEWVHDWFSGKGAPSAPAVLPHHISRYIKNDANVPPGYFSILQETGIGLFGPLHNLGFEIPKGWVPDISVGKLFCAWLREQHGVDTDSLPTYRHDYLDGRIVEPKLYPDEWLAEYRRWFRSVWLPEHGVRYFKKKDPSSLMYLDKLPALAGPKRSANLPHWKKPA